MQTITQGKYEFQLTEQPGKFIARLFNNNAKSELKRYQKGFFFRTIEQRDGWVMAAIDSIKSNEEKIAKRKQARKEFINPAKIGDILESSWGYDQTNIDYFQIVGVKGKSVVIREIGFESKESAGVWATYHVTPKKDGFLKDSPELLRRVRPSTYTGDATYSVKVDECRTAYPWDGKPGYQTEYA